MAQQSLLNNDFSLCNVEQAGDLSTNTFDNDFGDDPSEKFLQLIHSMNDNDSNYQDRNATPYNNPSATRMKQLDTKPRGSDIETSSRVVKPKRKHNNGDQSSKKQKTIAKPVSNDANCFEYQQEQQSTSQNVEHQKIDNLEKYTMLQEKLRLKYE